MAAGPVSKLFSQPVEPKPGLIDQHRLGIELGQDVPSGRRPALRLRQVLFCLEIHFGLSVASLYSVITLINMPIGLTQNDATPCRRIKPRRRFGPSDWVD